MQRGFIIEKQKKLQPLKKNPEKKIKLDPYLKNDFDRLILTHVIIKNGKSQV